MKYPGGQNFKICSEQWICAARYTGLLSWPPGGYTGAAEFIFYGFQLILKIILLAVIGWLVYRLLKGYTHSVEQDRPVPPPSKAEVEDMVRCAECGVHLPRSESILSKGEFFCCEAHRQKHQR